MISESYFPFGFGIFQGEMKDQRLPDKASKVPRTFILGYAGGASGNKHPTKDGQCWMFSMLLEIASFPRGFAANSCGKILSFPGFKFLNGSSDAIEWQAERLQGPGYLLSDDSPGKRLTFCSH